MRMPDGSLALAAGTGGSGTDAATVPGGDPTVAAALAGSAGKAGVGSGGEGGEGGEGGGGVQLVEVGGGVPGLDLAAGPPPPLQPPPPPQQQAAALGMSGPPLHPPPGGCSDTEDVMFVQLQSIRAELQRLADMQVRGI